MDELLDIVNQEDMVIGTKWRSEVYADRGSYIIRSVWLFVVNDKGQLWIPRRTVQKKLNPSALDGSCVGHVSAGESYEQAMEREAQEELNIDLAKIDYKQVAYMGPHVFDIPAFVKVYQITMNDAPDYNKEDYQEYYWLSPNEILERINAGDVAKSYLPVIVTKLYANLLA